MAGGTGGNGGGGSWTGAGGRSAALGPGETGGNATFPNRAGGGGGAGETGGAGGAGGSRGGNGGQGGVHGQIGSGLPLEDVTGSSGQAGTSGGSFGGNGGGGGAGGYGYVETDGGILGDVSIIIKGGAGGAGGPGTNGLSGGQGGDGGIGLYLNGTSSSLTISGNISGGQGGLHGGPYADPEAGGEALGGAGVFGQNLNVTIDGGTVAGGLNPQGTAHANSIVFADGINQLQLKNDWHLDGAVRIDNGTLRLGQDDDVTLSNVIEGSGALYKVGAGTLTLTGANTFLGGVTLSEGAFVVEGSVASALIAGSGTEVSGTGTIGAATFVWGAGLAPGNGVGSLSTGDLHLETGSTLWIEFADWQQYDQVEVNGTVTLGGDLDLSLLEGFVSPVGHEIVFIDNDGVDEIVGTFAGFAEGATFLVDDTYFTISYEGGDGNDVSLTSKGSAPIALTLDSQQVAHSEGANAAVGTFATVDMDSFQSHVYSLVDGYADNALFAIDDDELIIVDPTLVLDGTYSIRVRTTDNEGLTFEQNFTISVDDDVQPTITSVQGPSAGNYKTGDVLRFVVEFSEQVRLLGDYLPILPLAIGGQLRFAELVEDASTVVTQSTFEYVIQAGDRDLDGIQLDFEPSYNSYADAAGNTLNYMVADRFPLDFDPNDITINVPTGGTPTPNPNPHPAPQPEPPVLEGKIPSSVIAFEATPNEDHLPVMVTGKPNVIDEVQIAGSVVLGDDLENAYLLGDGNYSVEGNSLDNVIYGNRGDTIIIASAGHDTIDGGWGRNSVHFNGEADDYVVQLADGVATITDITSGSSTRVSNVDELVFADGSQALFATSQILLTTLYQAILDRLPDAAGFSYWMGRSADGVGFSDIANSFLASIEFHERDDLDDPASFITGLYEDFLLRQADEEGLAYWIERVEAGVNIGDIAISFALADEVGERLDMIFPRDTWLDLV